MKIRPLIPSLILLLGLPNLVIADAIVNIEDMRREGDIGFFT